MLNRNVVAFCLLTSSVALLFIRNILSAIESIFYTMEVSGALLSGIQSFSGREMSFFIFYSTSSDLILNTNVNIVYQSGSMRGVTRSAYRILVGKGQRLVGVP
jgi:hypothetical protein